MSKRVKVEEEQHETEPVETAAVAVPLHTPGDMDALIATAKTHPRAIARFRKDAEDMATLDEETAGECIYALKRKDRHGKIKIIEGPSTRFAEILLYAWGNARADAEVVDETRTHVVSMGTFFDLERLVAVRKKVARRITDRNGRRYNDDMIVVTGNAANSIALRNAVFAGIPKALWKGVWQKARTASLGKGGTLTQKRQKMLDWFGKLGVTAEEVFAALGLEGIEDIGEDELIALRGFATAIKDGETNVEQVFRSQGEERSNESDALNEKLRAEAEQRELEKAAAGAEGADGKPPPFYGDHPPEDTSRVWISTKDRKKRLYSEEAKDWMAVEDGTLFGDAP